MNSNSPMMHRVTRQKQNLISSVTLPRKGRIRLTLDVLLTLLFICFGPFIFQSFKWSSAHYNESHKTAAVSATASIKKRISSTHQLLSWVVKKIGKKPTLFTAIHTLPLSENDSIRIYTSIDTTLKKYNEKLLRRYHPLYGAIAAIHPPTGRIVSMVTYTHDTMPDLGTNLCCKSIFPAASIFKTVTAAAAIEHASYTPMCQLEHQGRTCTLYRSQLKPYFERFVEMSFTQAYARSVNSVFGRIGIYDLGRERLLETAYAFGFNSSIPGDLKCESSVAYCTDSTFEIAEFASGFNQRTLISPLHAACIAAACAENGVIPIPTLIDSITDVQTGAVKYKANPSSWRTATTPHTAESLRTLMQAVIRYGTARKQFRTIKRSSRFDDFIIGGKTGSIDKDGIGRVDWFIGFASHPQRSDERIAVSVITAHDAYWTVHSSYLAAETMRSYLRGLQKKKERLHIHDVAATNDSSKTSGQ